MVFLEDPALWTHALMDLGAAVCRPVPRCDECPARTLCAYAAAAGADGGASRPRARRVGAPQPSFESTSRWLRGRLLQMLREAPHGAWQTPPGHIGRHGSDAITAVLGAMVRDGLVEWDGRRARLPAAEAPASRDNPAVLAP
jgi:hypothetical protein